MCCCECKCQKGEAVIRVEAPNYLGSPSDLVKAIEKAEQIGALDHIKSRFARGGVVNP